MPNYTLQEAQRIADASRGRAGKPGIGGLAEYLKDDPYYLRSILGAVLGASGAIRPGGGSMPPGFSPRPSFGQPYRINTIGEGNRGSNLHVNRYDTNQVVPELNSMPDFPMGGRLSSIPNPVPGINPPATRGAAEGGRANSSQFERSRAKIDELRNQLQSAAELLMQKPKDQWTQAEHELANRVVDGLSSVEHFYNQLENAIALNTGSHRVHSNPYLDRQLSGGRDTLGMMSDEARLTGNRFTGTINDTSRFNHPGRPKPPGTTRGPSDRSNPPSEISNLISEHHNYTGGRTRNRGSAPRIEDVGRVLEEIPQFYVGRDTTGPGGSRYVTIRNRQTSFMPRFGMGDINDVTMGPIEARVRFTPNDPHAPSGDILASNPVYHRNMFLDTSGHQNPFLNSAVARDPQGNLLSQNRYVFRNELRRRLLERLENPQSRPQGTQQEQVSPDQLSFLRALLGEQ